jgi:signal transduction histidine kinase
MSQYWLGWRVSGVGDGDFRHSLAIHEQESVFEGNRIPEEARGSVFERFYRVNKSRSRKTGGTGLGLAIVKHTAMAFGAKITLESRLGEGTRVTVRF